MQSFHCNRPSKIPEDLAGPGAWTSLACGTGCCPTTHGNALIRGWIDAGAGAGGSAALQAKGCRGSRIAGQLSRMNRGSAETRNSPPKTFRSPWVYEDGRRGWVVDKPVWGWLVHPGAGKFDITRLQNAFARDGPVARGRFRGAGIIHRLDKEHQRPVWWWARHARRRTTFPDTAAHGAPRSLRDYFAVCVGRQ